MKSVTSWRKRTLGLAVAAMVSSPVALAFAQAPGEGEPPAPPPEPPAAEQPAPTPGGEQPAEPAPQPPPKEEPPGAPPSAAPSPAPKAAPERFPTVFRAPQPPPPPPRKRKKPLLMSVGLPPTASDFGAEADIVSPLSKDPAELFTRKWQATIRAFLRAPARVGIGPRNDGTSGNELHSPPRMVGLRQNEWNYIGVAPPPHASLYFAVENNRVSGNVIISTDTFFDAGYDHLDEVGGVAQAYVTLKFPDAFGINGGLAWTVGAFSSRYGNAGPGGKSTGYYGTYLFGRTHIAGETLTADIDLNDDLELVLEHGLGAKLEVNPFDPIVWNPQPGGEAVPSNPGRPPTAPYLPYQGPVPQGSNFVHHAHAGLHVSDWLKIGGHYLTSWTPNDFTTAPNAEEGRMTIFGGDVHVDGPKLGSGYVGYSYVQASDILPLSNGVEVLHSPNGYNFKQNYFGPLHPQFGVPIIVIDEFGQPKTVLPAERTVTNDSGTVQTVLAQYILRLAPFWGGNPQEGPDVALAAFGMLNHVETNVLKQNRFKFGGEIEVSPVRYFAIGTRFDRVLPDGQNPDVAYSALSPRVIVHTNWLSREYIILSYTRFFMGSQVGPSELQETAIPLTPYYTPTTDADPNLIYLAAVVSF